jgi:TetR/AcrR family transcriptional repressor of nem operon
MGRPKNYERATVTEAAMKLFWQRGYHDASTRELVDVMGINMNTLYTEFGTKAGLFTAAIEHYEQHVVPAYIGALEQPDASIDTIRNVLNAFATFADTDDFVPGCLITNTATELAPTAEASQRSMARYIDRLDNAFVNALEDSSAGAADVAAMARFLTTTMIGLFVMIRAQTSTELLQLTVDTALDYVESNLSRPRPIRES